MGALSRMSMDTTRPGNARCVKSMHEGKAKVQIPLVDHSDCFKQPKIHKNGGLAEYQKTFF